MLVSFFVDRNIFSKLKERRTKKQSGIWYFHWNGWMWLQNEHVSREPIVDSMQFELSLCWWQSSCTCTIHVDTRVMASNTPERSFPLNGYVKCAFQHAHRTDSHAFVCMYCICRYIKHFWLAHISSNTKLITFTMQIYSWMSSTKTWTAFEIVHAYWICAADSINDTPKRQTKTNVNVHHYQDSGHFCGHIQCLLFRF